MKITEFEEMKIYSYSKNDYRINRGVLETNAINNEWTKSTLPYNTVIELEFIPFIEYVSYEKAFEHMKIGGEAEHNEFTYAFSETTHCLEFFNCQRWVSIYFFKSMLDDKWILK